MSAPVSGAGKNAIFIATHQLFSIRYLLGTDIFKLLKARNLPIVIITPNADNVEFRRMFEDEGVWVEKFDYDSLSNFTGSRAYQFFARVRQLTLPEGLNIDTIRMFEAEELSQKGKSKFWKARFTEMVILTSRVLRKSDVLRRAFVRMERMLFKSDAHRALFARYRPKLMVIADIGTIKLSNFLIDEAQRRGARVVSIVLSWDNLTSKGIGSVMPDWAIAWNDNMKNELVSYHGMRADRVEVCGVAHFDVYFREPQWAARDEFLSFHHLSPDRRTIFYGTNTPGMFRHNKQLIEALLTAIRDERLREPCQLLVRLHPAFFSKHKSQYGDAWREFAGLSEKFGDLLAISRPVTIDQDYGAIQPIEDQLNLAAILDHSDVMVNIFSTLMLEACIFDLPVINVGFYQFASMHFDNGALKRLTHIKRIVDYGAVRIAYNEQELVDLVNRYLADPTLDHEQRMQVRENEAGPNKGAAAAAIAARIEELYAASGGMPGTDKSWRAAGVENGNGLTEKRFSVQRAGETVKIEE